MLGAIIGDIVGSVYEWNNIKTKDFPLFREDCFFTDDTVMTVAVADAIMKGSRVTIGGGFDTHKGIAVDGDLLIDSMKKWGRLYPNAGYGGQFGSWLISEDREPYNSWGNGSAMRVSPCAWMMDCGFAARVGLWPTVGRGIAELSAAVTHNHPEGIKGALAVTDAIFMCRFYTGGYGDDMGNPHNERYTLDEYKMKIKAHIEREHGYDLSRTLDDIRPGYRFNESCQETVPQAIIAFLESTGFEDAIRNAISLGGDSDTLAAITGSIAEAFYGVPEELRQECRKRLTPELAEILIEWEKAAL